MHNVNRDQERTEKSSGNTHVPGDRDGDQEPPNPSTSTEDFWVADATVYKQGLRKLVRNPAMEQLVPRMIGYYNSFINYWFFFAQSVEIELLIDECDSLNFYILACVADSSCELYLAHHLVHIISNSAHLVLNIVPLTF
jgi:hypothetical protein